MSKIQSMRAPPARPIEAVEGADLVGALGRELPGVGEARARDQVVHSVVLGRGVEVGHEHDRQRWIELLAALDEQLGALRAKPALHGRSGC
ncbi:MAG: hypothetical protein U0836_07405 [Pirellulales bacterium]